MLYTMNKRIVRLWHCNLAIPSVERQSTRHVRLLMAFPSP